MAKRNTQKENASGESNQKETERKIFTFIPFTICSQKNMVRFFSKLRQLCIYKEQHPMLFNNIPLQQVTTNNIFTFVTGKKMDAFRNCL